MESADEIRIRSRHAAFDRATRVRDYWLRGCIVVDALEIPWRELSEEALGGVIEEFVTREGTVYGEEDVPLRTKIDQVRRQLERGEVLIFFDTRSNSCQLLTRDEARTRRLHAAVQQGDES